jgi:copper homeostasis protein
MLEVCVEDVVGLQTAVAGGADRIELCSALSLGGLTPSGALMRAAAGFAVPTYVLIRPRAGDFVYGADEEALIVADLQMAAELGLAGLVLGANRPDNSLDTELLGRLIAHARAASERRGKPLGLTLHRAFDLCPDPLVALEQAIALGFERVLTSGGAPGAFAGCAVLGQLARAARGRIRIMAGSGIDPDNVGAILATGVDEVHASCQVVVQTPDSKLIELGFTPRNPRRTDPARIAALRAAITAATVAFV